MLERRRAVVHLARVLRRLQLGQQLAQLAAPARSPARAASSSPRSSGAGGPSRRQSSAAAIISRARLEVGLDHLRAGQRAGAAGREAVGDGEQGDVDADRLGRPQVLVDAARRQRRLGDQEAEPQVVQRQPLQVLGEAAAGAQAAADLADRSRRRRCRGRGSRRSRRVRPGSPACRCRGRGRRSAAPCRGVISSASGSASSAATSAARSPAKRSRSRLDLERVLEHRQGVAVDVEVVVGALLDPAQALQLGQDDRGQLQLVEQSEAAQRVGAAEQLPQLGQLALAGGLGGAGRGGAGQRDGAGVDLEAELGGEARRPQQPQRVLGEAALADRPQHAALEVGEAAEGVDRLAAGERHGDGADREVARGRGRPRSPSPRRAVDVDLPAALGGDDAPGAELGRELEGVLAELAGDRLAPPRRDRRRRRGRGRRPRAERRVADGAADDPDAVARRPAPARRRERPEARRRAAIEPTTHAGAPRHPGRDPAGDLVVDRVEAGGDLLGAGSPPRPGRRSAPPRRPARPRSRDRGRS